MSPAKKSSAKKAAPKKASTKKSVAKKKSAAKKSVAKKSAVKKASAKKSATKKAAPAKKKAAPAKKRASAKPAPVRDVVPDEVELEEVELEEPSPSEPYRPTPNTVVVRFGEPGAQRRLTVAFRLLLAIPHFVALWLLSIAAFFVVFIGWFVALALGRLPDGFARFLGNVVEYGTRISAYAVYLLTDQYPPLSFDAPYAVSVDVAPGQLNRAAVFFRLIIAFPAYLVVTILQYGYWAAAIVIWLIVLIAGRMPTALWQANAAVLRYVTRFYAYMALVTSEYPWGLFGDRE